MKQELTLHTLSPQDFLALGINDVAYVAKHSRDGEEFFEIHSADGNVVATLADRDVAFALVRQNDLEPLSVH
jgi:hypothetical protein